MGTTMKSMTRWLVLVAASAVAGCEVQAVAEGQGPSCDTAAAELPTATEHPRAAALQAGLEAIVDAGLPGAVMAIRDADGVWQGAAGYADLGRRIPMDPCHRTRIASVTKTFVAATVLLLVEEGLVDLDAPVTAYLNPPPQRLPHAADITIRHLLSHTSGVHNYLDVPFALELFNRPSRTWTIAECYEHAMDSDPEFGPGQGWSYSNTNYILAAWIIEAVTGKPHQDVMAERIFAPLGLQATSYRPDQFAFEGVARGYFDLNGDRTLVDSSDTFANSCVGPDGGMVSNAHDLLLFYDTLLRDEKLLDPGRLEAMLPFVDTDYPGFPEYGLGLETWSEDGHVGYGHGGHEFGYRTFAYYFPREDVTFVLWVNASSLIPTDDNISAIIDAERNRLRDLALR